MSSGTKWTKEEDDILKYYLGNFKEMSYRDIQQYIPERNFRSLKARANLLKINRANHGIVGNRYSCNQDFWSKPNLINSYWAGFVAGDGCITTGGLKISLSSKDKEHLQTFKTQCGSTHPLRIKKVNFKAPTVSGITEIAFFYIGSIKWVEDLNQNFNLIPNKVYRLGPPKDFGDYLWAAWLIGYLDADGTIYYQPLKPYLKNPRLSMHFVSSSQDILIWIKNFTDSLYNEKIISSKSKIRNATKANAYRYSVGGIRAAVLIDFLRQFNVPKLSRKWNKPEVLDFIELQKQKYPQYFTLNYDKFVESYTPNKEILELTLQNTYNII